MGANFSISAYNLLKYADMRYITYNWHFMLNGVTKMGSKIALVLALVLVLAASSTATTYYVSKTGSGTDGRSWQSAWTTISQVNNGVSSGDTVFFGTGLWSGTQLNCVAGTPTDRTVYACSSFAETNGDGEYHFAKIWASNPVTTSWSAQGNDIWRTTAPAGFANAMAMGHPGVAYRYESTITGDEQYNVSGGYLYVRIGAGKDPNDYEIHVSSQPLIYAHEGSGDAELDYVTLWGLYFAYGYPRLIDIWSTVTNFRVEHCKLIGAHSSGFNNPALWYSGNTGAAVGTDNAIVACSLAYAFHDGRGGHGCGISVYSQSDMVVDSCTFYGKFDGVPLIWKNDTDNRNYRNIVKNSLFTPSGSTYSGVGLWLFRNQYDDSVYNNVFSGSLSSGVRIGNNTSRPNVNNVILNNTFIDCAGLGGDPNCIDGYATTGTVFKYNVEYKTSTPFAVQGECLDANDLEVDSNIYVVGSAQAEYGYNNYVSQSYWVNTLGHDGNAAFFASVSDIGFADYNNADYRRAPDSVEMTAFYGDRTWLYYGADLTPGVTCPPPPPPRLAGPADGSTGLSDPISLSWNSSTGADNYQVNLDNSPFFDSRELDEQTTGLSVTVSNLQEGAVYYWRVRAEDTCGWGAWSDVWTFVPYGDAPTGPVNYALGIPPQVDGSYSGYSPSVITDGTADPYGGTSTTWASQESSTAAHWIETDFGATRQINQVVVKWAFNANRDSWMTSQQFHVQRWTGSNYEDVRVVTSPVIDSVTVITFPEVSTSRMRIFQPANMGPVNYPTVMWLTELEELGGASGEIDSIPPAAIDDLGAVPGSDAGEIILSWTASGDDGSVGTLDRYEVMWSLDEITDDYWSADAILHSPQSPGTTESYAIAELRPGFTYYLAVRGFDDFGNETGLSNVVASFAAGIRPPPWLFTAVDEFGQTANLTCSTVVSYMNVDSYRFALVDSASGDTTIQTTSTINNETLSVEFTGLDESALYYWLCRAVATGTDSSYWSPPKKFRLSNVSPDPPAAEYPKDFDTVFASADEFTIVVANGTDDDSTGTLRYDFELYDQSSSNPLVTATDITEEEATTAWTVPVSLAGNTTYSWRARSFDGLEYSFWMDWAHFTIVGTATGDFASEPEIIAYPNPVHFTQGEYITFRLPDYPVDLLIQTVSGETVLLKAGLSGNWHWYGENGSGNTVAVGIYSWFVRGTSQNGKIVVKP